MQLVSTGLEVLDLASQRIRRGVERLAKTREHLGGHILAVDAGLDLIQRGFDRFERGWLGWRGRFCPRGIAEGRGSHEKRPCYRPKNRWPAQSKPNAPDRHETVSLLVRDCHRERRAFRLALRITSEEAARRAPHERQ